MAEYTTISDSQVDPDAPLTSNVAYAWRDNPIAIAEGAVGAPKVEDAALSGAPTAGGSTWVRNRFALVASGQVGVPMMCRVDLEDTILPGQVVPGSRMQYSSASGVGLAGTLSGTWVCLGYVSGTGSGRASLFLRRT